MAIVAACEILRKLVALPLFNASSPNLAWYYRMAFQYIIYIVIKINYSLTFSLHGSILMNLFDACASR